MSIVGTKMIMKIIKNKKQSSKRNKIKTSGGAE